MAPNNRPLGQGASHRETYASCLAEVHRLRAGHARLTESVAPVESTGQWSWRVALDTETVAVASRSYLRMRECAYNLERFLTAIPDAVIVDGARGVRGLSEKATIEGPGPHDSFGVHDAHRRAWSGPDRFGPHS